MTTLPRPIAAIVLGLVLTSPASAQFGSLLKGLVQPQPDAAAQAAQAQAQADAAQGAAQAAAQAAATPPTLFSKTIAPEQAAAMGLGKLSPEELAQLDAAVSAFTVQAQAQASAALTAALAGAKPPASTSVPAPDESMAPGFLGIPGAPKLGIPGMDGTPVTADSLLGAIAEGGGFFLKANVKYAEALLPAERVKEINDSIAGMNPKDGQAAMALIASTSAAIKERADAMLKEGKALSERARQLIDEGNAEIGKGILKWGVLTVMVARTFKLGGNDEKMLAAIVVAKNAIKDIVDLKKLQGTMSDLAKLRDPAPAEGDPAAKKL
jgi:hypothetical protein